MSKPQIKTVQAKNVTMRVPIAYCGTAEAPVRPVHATAYRRAEGAVTIACADGTSVEVRPTDKVRISYDPAGIKARNLRWCKGGSSADRETYPNGTPCEGNHLRRIGTDKAATAYCDTMLAWYRANPLDMAGLIIARDKAQTNAINARIGRVMDRPEASRERQIASVLRARMATYGVTSPSVEAAAKDYGMTVAEAVTLVEREYEVTLTA